MENKLTSTAEDLLLKARKEALTFQEESSLRPLGKMWGMDVFTWSSPYPGMLSNTLHAFPFPVIWIGNSTDVLATLDGDQSLCTKIHSLILFDAPIFELKGQWVDQLRNCAGTSNVNEAMEMLKVFKESHKVLLFTSSGENGTQYRTEFENYVKLVQGI